MALNITPKIGILCLSPIAAGDQTSDQPTSFPAALCRPIQPATDLRCRVQRSGAPDLDLLSPTRSPRRSPRIQPDLEVAFQALVTGEMAKTGDQKVREYLVGGSGDDSKKGVPVFVMLPLDTVKMNGSLNRRKAMAASLTALKSAGVEGIMVDVWWGLVEREGPTLYNWGGYKELIELCSKIGLKVQAVMSFHQCGGNVGDSCT